MSETVKQIGNDGKNGYLVIGNYQKASGLRWKLVSNANHVLAGVDHKGYSPVNFHVGEKLLMFGDDKVLYVTDDNNTNIGSIRKYNIRNLHTDNSLAQSLRETLESSGYGLLMEMRK